RNEQHRVAEGRPERAQPREVPLLGHEPEIGKGVAAKVTAAHVDRHERPTAAACDIGVPRLDGPLLRTGQLEQAPEQRSVSPPTLGNLLEVPPEIDVNRRIVSLPQAAILVAESLESQPRQRKMRTGRIVEIEELLPLPRRQRGGRTVP